VELLKNISDDKSNNMITKRRKIEHTAFLEEGDKPTPDLSISRSIILELVLYSK